jgi:hypothetical protein
MCREAGCNRPTRSAGYCTSDYATHRRQAQPRRQKDRLRLPSDNVIDDLAVGIAVRGSRVVPLTQAERWWATAQLLTLGGNSLDVEAHLGVTPTQAQRLANHVRQSGLTYNAIRPTERE